MALPRERLRLDRRPLIRRWPRSFLVPSPAYEEWLWLRMADASTWLPQWPWHLLLPARARPDMRLLVVLELSNELQLCGCALVSLLEFLKGFTRARLQRPKEAVTGPLGLSPEQLDSLDQLRSTPAWRHYTQAVEGVYQQQLAALIRPLGHDAYLFQCGVVFALERAATLVDDLLSARDHHAKRAKSDQQPDVRAVLSTPFWDAYQRTRARSS